MAFEDNIKEWVTLDNQLRLYSTKVKQIREQKVYLSNSILAHVVKQDLTKSTIEITDGLLKFQNVKITSPLTFKFITECLTDCISNEEQVKLLVQYIKQKRDVRYVPEVKRTYKK